VEMSLHGVRERLSSVFLGLNLRSAILISPMEIIIGH
jgi:hypothetical protein